MVLDECLRIIKNLIHETESYYIYTCKSCKPEGKCHQNNDSNCLKFAHTLELSVVTYKSFPGPSHWPSLTVVEFETCGRSAFDCLVQRYQDYHDHIP